MRNATKEEHEIINNYIDSISQPTCIRLNFNSDDLDEPEQFKTEDSLIIEDAFLSKDVLTPAEQGIEVFTSKIECKPAIASFKVNNITIEVCDKESIPNKFRRFMQKLLLGIEWEIF